MLAYTLDSLLPFANTPYEQKPNRTKQMKLGDITISYVRAILETFESLGGDPKDLSKQFNLSDAKLGQPEGRISIPRFMRLGHSAIEQTGRADLGLEMGKRVKIPLLGLTGFLAMTAKDIESACIVMAHYERLSGSNSRGQSSFYIEDGFGVSSFYSISPYNEYNYFVVDSVISSQKKIIEWISGRTGALKRVEVEFEAPSYAQAYEDCLECPVLFGQKRNALIIKPEALTWPLVQHDKNAFLNLQRICDERLAQASRDRSLNEKVMDEISPLLEGQTPSINQVADSLGMPPWTLRRKLQEQNTSYQTLLNDTRKALAESYIKDTHLAIGEIAYLLGFSSPTAFQRAFKRWTQISPGQFRIEAGLNKSE